MARESIQDASGAAGAPILSPNARTGGLRSLPAGSRAVCASVLVRSAFTSVLVGCGPRDRPRSLETDILITLAVSGLVLVTWAWRRRGKAFLPVAWRAKLLLIALGALSAALAMEICLRILGVQPPPVPQTADEDRLRIDDQVNALGLREDWDSPPPRQPGEVRVAMLGDSFVFGEAVARQQAMPVQLQSLLQQDRPEAKFRVFNLGKSDNDTAQEFARYRNLHPVLQDDVVILVGYLNDFARANPAYTLNDIYDAGGRPGFLSEHSRLVANLWSRVRRAIMQRRSVAWYRETTLDNMDQDFKPMAREILALKAWAEARNVKFVFVFFPWLYALDDYPLAAVHAHVAEFAQRNGIAFLDLLPVFRGQDADKLRVSEANEHPNAAAHAQAARAIATFVEPLILPTAQ